MENKQERILDAAFERFKHFGFLKTTVDEIARQAQVGKGTIYSYFKNKDCDRVGRVMSNLDRMNRLEDLNNG